VNTFDFSFYKIMRLIEETMPSVNCLTLNCEYPNNYNKSLSNISLEQVRILALPQYGKFSKTDSLNWSRLFPCVERLNVSISSKRQIPFLIDQFKNMISGFFHGDLDQNKPIQVTRQWLKKHTDRLRSKDTNSFVCQINDRYFFSLCLWIDENDEVSKTHSSS
jgi:hypothetical protein